METVGTQVELWARERKLSILVGLASQLTSCVVSSHHHTMVLPSETPKRECGEDRVKAFYLTRVGYLCFYPEAGKKDKMT